jgi:hypothetical protein
MGEQNKNPRGVEPGQFVGSGSDGLLYEALMRQVNTARSTGRILIDIREIGRSLEPVYDPGIEPVPDAFTEGKSLAEITGALAARLSQRTESPAALNE